MQMKLAALGLVAAMIFTIASAQQQPNDVVLLKATTTSAGQPIVFPSANVEVTGTIGERPPGWSSPWHKHPYPRYHYVLDGTLTVEDESGKRTDYPAGSFSIEQVNTWHRAMNLGSKTAKWLYIDSAEAGKPNAIPKPK